VENTGNLPDTGNTPGYIETVYIYDRQAWLEDQSTDDEEDAYYNWAISALGAQDGEQFEACIENLQRINPQGWRTLMARADYEEINEHLEAAWVILCDAFEAVLDNDAEAPDARDYVLATLFRFAKRNRMEIDAAPYVDRIFDEGIFTEEVLAGLQALQHNPIEAVTGYQVVLQGKLDDTSDPVYVLYGVSGTSPEMPRPTPKNSRPVPLA